MKILVTGAKGFVGKNLCAQLKNIRDGKARNYGVTVSEVYEYDLDSTPEELDAWSAECDFVFNLAGVNRPKEISETKQAKASPRLRMNLDLRNSPEDQSQRMLNAIEPGTVMPVHRHRSSSETVVCVRGHFEEYLYDESGTQVETVDMLPGGNVLNVPAGQWHSLKSLASGTILLECKDGKYEPLGEGDVMG